MPRGKMLAAQPPPIRVLTTALAFLALTATGSATPAPPCPDGDPVVALVGPIAVTACDVRRHLERPGGRDAALRRALSEAALALEARAQLGADAASWPVPEAARRLSAHLFDPGLRCATLPDAPMRRRYAETRWRFVAPPAWVVDDLQVLCCGDPRECEDPDVAPCLDATRPEADALRERLGDRAALAALTEVFDQALASSPRLALRRYTFFFDPAQPDARIDGRLQEVDREIALAASALSPGEISPVITTRFGHHILRLARARPAVALPWDDPRAQAILRVELCPAHLERQRDQLVTDLLTALRVTIDPVALEAVTDPN